jgi:hypothetical protein
MSIAIKQTSPSVHHDQQVKHHHFDEAHIIHELKHFLPSQQALKDFIHHNSLHAFQHMKFYDAIFKASKIFGFQVHLQLPGVQGVISNRSNQERYSGNGHY